MNHHDDPRELLELLDDETDASEQTRGEPLAHPVRRGGNRTKVFGVRLTEAEHDEIQRLAAQADIPASGLVRRWVETGMAAEQANDSLEQTVASLTRDVQRLRQQLTHT